MREHGIESEGLLQSLTTKVLESPWKRKYALSKKKSYFVTVKIVIVMNNEAFSKF